MENAVVCLQNLHDFYMDTLAVYDLYLESVFLFCTARSKHIFRQVVVLIKTHQTQPHNGMEEAFSRNQQADFTKSLLRHLFGASENLLHEYILIHDKITLEHQKLKEALGDKMPALTQMDGEDSLESLGLCLVNRINDRYGALKAQIEFQKERFAKEFRRFSHSPCVVM